MDAHKNLAYSLVATAPSPAASGTTLVVTAGQGTRFPAVPFNATVWASGEVPTPTNAEIVRVTNISTDTLTITRAQEGTSARTIVVGDQIAATVTALTLTDVEDAISNETSARTAKDDVLSNAISVVSQAVSAETSARVAADNALSNTISVLSSLVSAAVVSIAVVSNAVSVEAATRANADSALSVRVDTVSNAVSVLSAALSTQISAISQAHSALSQAVSVADAALSVRIDTQSNAISVLSAAHVSAVDRISAVSGLVSTTASALSARIDTVSNAVSVLSATLSTAISAISQAHSALSQAHSATSAKLASVMSLLDGGTTGQVLKKIDNTDFNFQWDTDLAGGSSSATVTSANISALSNRLSVLSAKLSTEISAISQAHSALSQAVSVADAALSVRIDTQSQAISALSNAHSATSAKLASVMSLLDGGTTGQVLKKVDNTDFNFIWDTDLAGGSSSATVTSANISALSNRLSVLSAALSTQMSAISQAHSALSQAVSVADAALSVRIDTQSNAISVLSAKLSTEISAISQAHSALSQAVSVANAALSVRIDTQSQAISVLSQQLSVLSQAHSALSQAHSVLSTLQYLSLQNLDSVTVSAGQAVYLWSTISTTGLGAFKLADASATGAARHPIGLVVDGSVAVSAVGRIVTRDSLSLLTAQWNDVVSGAVSGLVPGSLYYIDINRGDLTTSLPPSPNAGVLVGRAVNQTELRLNIGNTQDWLSNAASALSVRIDTVSNAVSVLSAALSTQISAISQAHSALSQAVSVADAALSVRIDTQSQAISVLSQQVSVLSNAISAISQAHSALSQAVSVLSADHLSLKDRVSGISATVSSLSADVTSVKDRVSANSALISTVASALSARIDTVSNAVSVVSSLVSTAASALSVRIDTVSNLVSALTSAHNALSNTVSALSVGPGSSGHILSLQNLDSVTVSAGAPVYLWSTISTTGLGAFKLADASATGGARRPIGVIMDGSVAVSATARVQTRDSLSLASAQWNDVISGATSGLVAGNAYYLDINRGKLTPTLPTGSNAGVLVGLAVNQTELRLVPGDVGDWLSDSISVGTATAADLSNKISALSATLSTAVSALSNSISILSAKLSTEISAMSQALSNAVAGLSTNDASLSGRIDALTLAVSVLNAGLGSVQMKVVAGAQSISGTALVKVSGLSVSAAASGIYQIEGFLMHAMSGASTLGHAVSSQTGTFANAALHWFGNISVGTGAQFLMSTAAAGGYFNEAGFGSVTFSAIAGAATNMGTQLRGVVAMSTTGGTLQIKTKAGTSGCVTIKAGSYLRAYKIA